MRYLILIFLFLAVQAKAQTLEGDATGVCDCFTLTTAAGQGGAVISPGTIDLTNPFDFTFNVYLGTDDVWGADGMTFMLKQTGTGMGATGNALGYGGIPNSIAVEIDTWNSSPAIATDVPSDHVGLDLNGVVEHGLVAPVDIPNVEDGLYHLLRITWDPGTTNLEVYLDGVSYFVYTGDIVTIAFGGNPNVYFGITASTGGAFNEQGVCMYRDADFSADLTTVCVGQLVTFTDASTSDLNMITDYAWDFGDGTTSTIQNPSHSFATAGVYSVQLTITDVSGCSDTETLDITVDPSLTLTMSQTNVTCFGDDDGTGTVVPTSGTGPYVFSWNDPASQTTATASSLGPGIYDVVVDDALGCTGTGSVTITEPSMLVIDAIATTNESCGISNGTITFTVSGGAAPYSYSIDGGTTFSGSPTFTGLSAATYNLVVEDANFCQVISTATVGLDSPLTIDDIVATDVSCGPVPDGTITVTASSGVTPYSYSLDGVTYQASNVFSGLSAGSYTVYVLDDSGCEVTGTIDVFDTSPIIIDAINLTDVTCNGGADGEIEILVSGGLAPYQYSIDGGTTFGLTNVFTGLNAGTYDVIIIDDNGCTASSTENLNEPTPIVFDVLTATDVSCFSGSDGTISISVSGGTPGYSYSIDGGATFVGTSSYTGLSAGNYNVEILDADLCTASSTVAVVEPSALMIDDVIVTDVTCNGLSDGEINIIVSGGTAPYSYSADGGTTFFASSTITGLSAGTIDIVVEDVNSCAVIGSVTINESAPLIATLGPDTTICQTGTANLCPTIAGGTSPFTYTWDGMAGTSCFSTGIAGSYEVIVEDANGCTSAPVSQMVNLYPSLSVLTGPDITICPNDLVNLSAEASGGIGSPYTYTWTNSLDASVLIGQFQTVNPPSSVTYTVTVTDECETPGASNTINILTYPAPTISFDVDTLLGCSPLPVNFTNTTDLSLINSFEWDFGNGMNSSSTSPYLLYNDPGCFDIVLSMETNDGCFISDTSFSLICVLETPEANFYFDPIEPDLFNLDVEFYNESENAITFDWSFGDGNFSNELNPLNTYPEIGSIDYPVTLVATSADGCVDSITKIVHIKDIVLYYIPNIFTPNGDPMNNTFKPIFIPGFTPNLYEFKIFNQWGELVFEAASIDDEWDGTYNGALVKDGVYVWQLTFLENETDFKYRHFGHVTVLK